MFRPALLRLVALAALFVPTALASQEKPTEEAKVVASTATVRESASKISYPTQLDFGDLSLVLSGTGLRTKTWFGVKVYAYGLYLDASSLKERLGAWKGKSKLTSDKKLYAKLLEDEQAKALRLVFARDVDAEDVRDAFVKSLQPRLKTARKAGRGDGTEALARFKGFFSLDQLKKKAELVFIWTPGGKLHTWVNGQAKEPLASKALAWALFDVYMGDKPIMKKGKRTMIERLPELLR